MDLNQLVTKVHALTSMVLRLKVKVHKLESAAELRKGRSERRPSRAKTGLSIPSFTFQTDKRLPYRFWAHVCMEFGKACKTARDFARWLVVDWISRYKLLNRKKILRDLGAAQILLRGRASKHLGDGHVREGPTRRHRHHKTVQDGGG